MARGVSGATGGVKGATAVATPDFRRSGGNRRLEWADLSDDTRAAAQLAQTQCVGEGAVEPAFDDP
jgi:hypothetical protein